MSNVYKPIIVVMDVWAEHVQDRMVGLIMLCSVRFCSGLEGSSLPVLSWMLSTGSSWHCV